MSERKQGVFTRSIHAGEEPDPITGALVPPLYQSTTYHLETAEHGAQLFSGEGEGYVYTRWGNPTQETFESRVAALEGGQAALATASGMAAVATALLTELQSGDHLVSSKFIYSGTHHLFVEEFPHYGIEATLVDATEPANVADALREDTKAIYIETPGNPTLKLNDIVAAAEIGRGMGITTFIDNTFATPINQRPLDLGIDVVIHSATKYLCGHGDAIGGLVVGSEGFIDRALKGPLRHFGGIISPFNAWLILRGVQTLPLRMERHNANAQAVASFLEHHGAVAWVSYPGLSGHPQHELAQEQMAGYGGMVCFEVEGGVEAGRRLMNAVELCSLAVSLGDTRTLICHSASTTHSTVPREERIAAGITDGLVRLSVGLEDTDDIIADLDRALRVS